MNMNHSKDYLELILSFPAEEKLKDSDKVWIVGALTKATFLLFT